MLRRYNNSGISSDAEIKGILISDCAILFMSEESGIDPNNWPNQLLSMLYLVRDYNIKMLRKNYLLTCSIACGPCDYEPRMDDEYVRKNSLMGQGYVRAFTDNEYGIPKIQAGEYRVVTEGFPDYPEMFAWFYDDYHGENAEEAFLTHQGNLLKSIDGRHIKYYWMLHDRSQIIDFTNEIKLANTKMYAGLKRTYKKYVRLTDNRT